MKKHYLVLCVMLLSAIMLKAQKQMFAYDVSVTNKTYTAFTDGKVVPVEDTADKFSGLIVDGDENSNFSEIESTDGFPIGFNFKYNGLDMNQFMVGTDGVIFLGNEAMTLPANSFPFQVFYSEETINVFGLVTKNAFYGTEDSEIRYKLEGTEGNRVLVIQYSNIGVNSSMWDVELMANVSFQYRLYEATGNIEMHLNNFEPIEGVNTGMYSSIKIGIKGAADDLLMLKDYEGGTTTAEERISYDEENFPANGTVITFIAPEMCETPKMQPTNVKLYPRSTSAYGSFDIADADHYMLLVNKENNFENMPKDKSTYVEGDMIGNVMVAGISTKGVISTSDILEENTTYYARLISYNAQCLEGPLYNLINPVELQITTMGAAPVLNCKNVSRTSISLALETGDETAMVVMTENEYVDPMYDRYTGVGAFGVPAGELKVGDVLEGGGKVIYIGKSNDNIVIDNLTEAKPYFFKAWNTNEKGGYSSNSSEQNLTTAYTTPWEPTNIKDYMQDIPAGWNYEGDWFIMQGEICNRGYSDEELTSFIETPFISLNENTARLVTDFVMIGGYGSSSYPFGPNDYLKVQITKDGINYDDLVVYNKDNKKEVNEGIKRMLLENYEEQTIRIRFALHTSSTFDFTLKMVKLEEKSECDYPLDVVVSNIIGSSATISWTPQSKETTWEISYKNSDVEEWGLPIEVKANPYVLMALEPMVVYDVRVRATMGDMVSVWSDVVTFQAGLSMPLDVTFDKLNLMSGWESLKGVLASPSELESSYTGFDFKDSRARKFAFSDPWSTAGNYWFVSPKILVDKDIQTEYNIELGLTMGQESSYSEYCTDQVFNILLSKDGETFNTDDVVFTLNQADFPAFGASATYSFTASGLSNFTKLAFYTSFGNGNPCGFYFDYLKFNFVEVPTSINGANAEAEVSYENGKLTVCGSRVEVYNVNGTMVMSANNVDTLDCSTLASGVYVAKVVNNGSTIIKKFFVR